MMDPNQRSPKHGKPRREYDIPDISQTNSPKGFYDSNGYFHPSVPGSAAPGQPAARPSPQRPSASQPSSSGGSQPAQASGRPAQPRPAPQGSRAAGSSDRSSPGNARSGNARSGAENGRRQKSRKNHHSLLIFTILVAVAVCLSAGLYGLYKSGLSAPDFLQINPDHQSAGTIVNTDDVVPYTQNITFAEDSSKPLYGKVVFLDPGHGGTDSGCLYPTDEPTMMESTINLTIAENTKAALESRGATVIMLRTDDSWVSLYQRISLTHLYCLQFANQFGLDTVSAADQESLITELSDTIQINSDTVDSGGMGIMVGTGVGSELELLMDLEADLTNCIYLSIHINSNPDSKMKGTQVYYVTDESVIKSETETVASDSAYQNNPSFPLREDYFGRDGARNEVLSQTLYDSITSAVPSIKTNSKSIIEDNYAVLRENNLTGALIEVGFITNKQDRTTLSDDEALYDISIGIADGIVNFFANNA